MVALAFATSVSLPSVSVLIVQPHGCPHLAQGLLGRGTGAFRSPNDNTLHLCWVLFIVCNSLLDWRQFFDNRLSHRFLAFQTTNQGTATTLLNPILGFLIGIYLVQLPHRATLRFTGVT